MRLFTGSSVAIVTPMNEDFSIDYEAFRNLAGNLIDKGVQALIVNGTTGESPTLNDDEVCELVKIAIEVSNKRVPIIVGTGSNNTEHALELSLKVKELGVDGLLIVTPYYNKTSQLGLIDHYTYIADNVDLPIILYSVPARTNVMIEVDTVLELAKHPNIVALKDATGNMNFTLKLLSKIKELQLDFDLYSGEDWNILPFIISGGIGVISVLSNVYPDITQKYCEYALNHDIEKAKEISYDLQEVNECLFLDVSPMNVKTALASKGLCKDILRRPLISTPEASKKKLLAAMERFEEKYY